MERKTDVLVIGAGPGGYPAAIRAAQLGKKVIVVEKADVGGVCLNVGCIPSKALITAAHQFHSIQYPFIKGTIAQESQFDVSLMQKWMADSIEKLRVGVRGLLKTNGCEYVAGTARFLNPHTIEVTTMGGTDHIEFEHCIIATGSRPIELPNFPFGENVVDSTGALAFTEVPRHLVVIGGGVIGLEIGTAWMKLGAELTVIEMQDHVLPGTDRDLVEIVERKLKKHDTNIHTKTRVVGYVEGATKLQVSIKTDHDGEIIFCDKVLVCVGRKPNTNTLGLADASVEVDARGFIPVNENCRTNVPHIFAVGDVVPGPMLAHKATNDGEVAATNTVAGKAARQARVIASVIFTDPEIATVGKTAAQVREETGFDPLVGTFPFSASGRAVASGETEGFCRVILDASSDKHYVAGVQIVGAHAGEMIGEATLAVTNGQVRASDIMNTVHAHPTLSEAMVEAVRVAVGEPLHLPPRKK